MKIHFSTNNYIQSYRNTQKAAAQTSEASKLQGKFDEIMIHSSQEVSAEQAFADSLSSRLLLEVKKPVSQEKVAQLRQEIEQGTYEVDVNCIADRIMLY